MNFMSITTTASNQHCGNKSWSTLHLEMHETQDQHGAQIMCFQAWERKRVFCSCFSPKYDQNSFCENLNKNKMTVLFCSSCLRSFHLVTILSALQQELFKAIFKAHRRKHMDVTYFFTAKYPLCKCAGSCINLRENRIRARHHSHTDDL